MRGASEVRHPRPLNPKPHSPILASNFETQTLNQVHGGRRAGMGRLPISRRAHACADGGQRQQKRLENVGATLRIRVSDGACWIRRRRGLSEQEDAGNPRAWIRVQKLLAHARMLTHTHTHTHMHTCTHAHMHTYTYIHTYTHAFALFVLSGMCAYSCLSFFLRIHLSRHPPHPHPLPRAFRLDARSV
jgi:hypothetical protein